MEREILLLCFPSFVLFVSNNATLAQRISHAIGLANFTKTTNHHIMKRQEQLQFFSTKVSQTFLAWSIFSLYLSPWNRV